MTAVSSLHFVEGSGIRSRSSDDGGTSTYEAMRLAVLDEVAQSKIDSRDRAAVATLVRAHVERYQRTAES